MMSVAAWQARKSIEKAEINNRPAPLMRAHKPKQPRRAAFSKIMLAVMTVVCKSELENYATQLTFKRFDAIG